MKKLLPIMLMLVLALTACGQPAERLNNEGNEAFNNQDYETAQAAYQQAQADAPDLAELHYNEANVFYRQEDYEQTQQQIEQALVRAEDEGGNPDNLNQHSFYNLGNTFFQTEQFEAAIEAFKEALRLNPDDVQAKHNLELALRQQQQCECQQEEQQQEEENNQDQEQDQQQNDQQQDGQQDDQQQDGQQDDQQQDDQQQNGQPRQVRGLTKEQARQLFEAAMQGTKSLEEYLQQIFVFPGGAPVEDW